MLPTEPGPILSDTVFVLLRDLVQDHTGVYFSDDKREILAEKLVDRLTKLGMDSFLDYFYLLRYGESQAEWRLMQDSISVPETYFWREMDQVWALTNHVLPKLAAQQDAGPLTIWSAPSTGSLATTATS